MKYAKHIHVLHLLSTIPVGIGAVTEQEATDAFDHLFSYIHEHWGKPVCADWGPGKGFLSAGSMSSALECRTMLIMKADELVAKLESLPPYFSEEVFPVSVARYMLRELAMPINYRMCKNLTEFYVRYGAMILS